MRHPFRLWLLLLFLITWAMSCIGAASYADLALQHVLTVALVVALVLHARGRPLNDASYLAILSLIHI